MTHVRAKTVYISGPMTGMAGWGRKAMDDAEDRLLALGADDVHNPSRWIDDFAYRTHEEAMVASVQYLVGWPGCQGTYDVLVLLPDWFKSEGCKVERLVAEACGIEVCTLDEVES